jgi:hypothetical protein
LLLIEDDMPKVQAKAAWDVALTMERTRRGARERRDQVGVNGWQRGKRREEKRKVGRQVDA